MKTNLIALNTIQRCNLDCSYCSTSYLRRSKKKPLSLDEKKAVIKGCKELGYSMISLSGSGEPMLDKDFLQLVKFILKEGLAVMVVTNGTLLNPKYAKIFFKNKVRIIFKLNSLDPEISDTMAGRRDSYSWVKYKTWIIPRGLKYLLDLGYPNIGDCRGIKPLQVQSVITRLNYKGLPGIARFCKENRIRFFVEDLIPVNGIKGIILSKDEYAWLYRHLKHELGLRFAIHQKKVGCTLGLNPIIDVNGDILTCYTRGTKVGNIRTEPLQHLFERCARIKHNDSLRWYEGLTNKFKTCPGRKYFRQN